MKVFLFEFLTDLALITCYTVTSAHNKLIISIESPWISSLRLQEYIALHRTGTLLHFRNSHTKNNQIIFLNKKNQGHQNSPWNKQCEVAMGRPYTRSQNWQPLRNRGFWVAADHEPNCLVDGPPHNGWITSIEWGGSWHDLGAWKT